MRSREKAALIALALAAGPALAQAPAQGDPSQGTGPLPLNVAPSPTPICADRPTKASVACTVPQGDIQIESDAINWSRLSDGGMTTDTILYTSPTVKYGITKRTDVEVALTPYETVRTPMDDGTTNTLHGIGDLTLKLKQRLTDDDAKTQVSLIPYVKAPTAKMGIGNGRWEGGLTTAVNIPLPAKFTLTLGPEIDILANDEGGGYHVGLIGLINLSHPIGDKVNVYAELWSEHELERDGTGHQYSADVAATYQLARTLQLDVGGNFGLTRNTPDEQLYAGVSTRF